MNLFTETVMTDAKEVVSTPEFYWDYAKSTINFDKGEAPDFFSSLSLFGHVQSFYME